MLRFSSVATASYVVMMFVWLTSNIFADEIVLANRSSTGTSSTQDSDGTSFPQDSQLITAGELWKFYHSQGITSVDRLTLNVECGEFDPNQLGSFNLQIQDPTSGDILTNLNIRPNTNKLEVPLEFDYMKRFSPESQELIRLDMSSLNVLAPETTITVDSEATYFKPLNLFLLGGFLAFWIAVFFLLNRATRPLDQETEDIVIRTHQDGNLDFESTETSMNAESQQTSASTQGQPNNSRPSGATVPTTGVRSSNMASAR